MKNLFKQVTLKIKYLRAILQRRRRNHVTFIGITGSAGKTTTKDLTATILANFGPCQQTFLSYNTLSSIVRTVLNTHKVHRHCVAELAGSGPGTLDRSIRVLKPDIAVITVIGRDHYSAFKSREAIAAEKGKVVLALPPQGIAVLNIDDPLVRSIGEGCNRRIIWFGEGVGATLRLREARSRWPEPLTLFFEYQNKTYEVRTELQGTHMALPVLASLGVALAADLPLEKAILAIAQVQPLEGRMQVVTGDDGVVFIRDDWKAPHWSLNEPLVFLREARADRKVAIVGTISDSSMDDTKKYKKVCRQFREFADLVVFVGPHAHRALRARKSETDTAIQGFFSIRYAATYLQTELRKGDLVLLKGSHQVDHLVRLIINRSRPIQCWKDRCGVEKFCDRCSKLYKSSPDMPFAAPIGPQTGPAVPVVVGLGNPEARFHHTLHNVGYRVLDALVQAAESVWQVQSEGWVSSIDLEGVAVRLLKPGVKMNINGTMVRPFLERTGSDPKHCIIVHGDADLSLGDVRLKSGGGDAGHKGVRSVITALGTESIPRVRLGVRRSGDGSKPERFVLTKFSAIEEAAFVQMIEKAAAMVREHIQSQHDGESIGEERKLFN